MKTIRLLTLLVLTLLIMGVCSCEEKNEEPLVTLDYRFTEVEFMGNRTDLGTFQGLTESLYEAYDDTLGVIGFDATIDFIHSGKIMIYFETVTEDDNSDYILIERSKNKQEFEEVTRIETECPLGCVYEYVDQL